MGIEPTLQRCLRTGNHEYKTQSSVTCTDLNLINVSCLGIYKYMNFIFLFHLTFISVHLSLRFLFLSLPQMLCIWYSLYLEFCSPDLCIAHFFSPLRFQLKCTSWGSLWALMRAPISYPLPTALSHCMFSGWIFTLWSNFWSSNRPFWVFYLFYNQFYVLIL